MAVLSSTVACFLYHTNHHPPGHMTFLSSNLTASILIILIRYYVTRYNYAPILHPFNLVLFFIFLATVAVTIQICAYGGHLGPTPRIFAVFEVMEIYRRTSFQRHGEFSLLTGFIIAIETRIYLYFVGSSRSFTHRLCIALILMASAIAIILRLMVDKQFSDRHIFTIFMAMAVITQLGVWVYLCWVSPIGWVLMMLRLGLGWKRTRCVFFHPIAYFALFIWFSHDILPVVSKSMYNFAIKNGISPEG
ncbi:hypothetical protein AAMO2058_000756900 [Amorphochlora amoebiformis]